MSANTLPELGVTAISGFLDMLRNPLSRGRVARRCARSAFLLPLFTSFKWPSVAYALDILAWERQSRSRPSGQAGHDAEDGSNIAVRRRGGASIPR